MYYLLNCMFTLFLTIAIGIVYTKEVSSTFIWVLLMIAAVSHLLASAYAESKYDKLKNRIEKLENKKEDK